MKLLTTLAFVITLSTAAYAIKCYACANKECSTMDCGGLFDRCFTSEINGVLAKGCQKKEVCVSPMECCEGDLCNSAPLTLPPVLLLGLTAFITLYLNQD